MWDTDELALLGELAAATIRAVLHGEGTPCTDPRYARFATAGASFVTLLQDGRLRGCIGSLLAERPLRDDVAANAQAAALRDPRFAPLAVLELPRTEVEVSVLSTPRPMRFSDEAAFYRELRVGVDGLIVEHRGRRATYLPSVWRQLPDARTFVRELRRKAGIEEVLPLTALNVQRYITQHSAPRPLAAT